MTWAYADGQPIAVSYHMATAGDGSTLAAHARCKVQRWITTIDIAV